MIFFTKGCNFRCSYCHNPELVIGKEKCNLSVENITDILKKRKNVVEAISICGGEPTLHENLIQWAKYIKKQGYKIKLDTNGTNPKMIKELIANKLIDFFAVDYKAPLKKYKNITKRDLKENEFLESLKLILTSGIDYELRTTIHSDLHSKEDIEEMIRELKKLGVKNYYLQKFVKAPKTLEDLKETTQNKSLVEMGLHQLKGNFENFGIRNV